MSSRKFIFCLVCLFILSCASGPSPKKEMISPEIKIKEIEASRQVRAMNEKIENQIVPVNTGALRKR